MVEPLVLSTINLFTTISERFLPTPTKSHYVFNMRDISKVFQGLYRADKGFIETKELVVQLWAHEVLRVFHDRLVSKQDGDEVKTLLNEQTWESSSKWIFRSTDWEMEKMPCMLTFWMKAGKYMKKSETSVNSELIWLISFKNIMMIQSIQRWTWSV